MPIFLSYSHKDREFAEKLAAHIVDAGGNVWVDRWELNVGDSLIQRVQEAVGGADAVLVVLSPSSVESEWCKKELSTGLIRELEEKRVVVLPVLYQDCEIPPFLRDKRYADFRENFKTGLSDVLEALARVTSNRLGSAFVGDFKTDWAIDWEVYERQVQLTITLVSLPSDGSYSVLTQITVTGDEAAAARYIEFAERGFEEAARIAILEFCSAFEDEKLRFVLSDEGAQKARLGAHDPKAGLGYEIDVTCRRLGEDSGKDILFEYGGYFGVIRDSLMARMRRPNAEELPALFDLVHGSGSLRAKRAD